MVFSWGRFRNKHPRKPDIVLQISKTAFVIISVHFPSPILVFSSNYPVSNRGAADSRRESILNSAAYGFHWGFGKKHVIIIEPPKSQLCLKSCQMQTRDTQEQVRTLKDTDFWNYLNVEWRWNLAGKDPMASKSEFVWLLALTKKLFFFWETGSLSRV